MDLLNRDLSKLIKVRMNLSGDVQEFHASTAMRLVNNGLGTLFEDEKKETSKVEAAAVNRGAHTAAQVKVPLRNTAQTR